jgi:hypothetical protein
MDESGLEATLEKELVRARLEVELFQKRRPVQLGRFEVLRCIGRGSLGVVYEARDLGHGGRVALKLLSRVDGRTIAQFKHEFRVLSGITHPNLVSLHELVCEREHWFVSMELIEGVPFDRWLWSEPQHRIGEVRVRKALSQLVDAVSVIHRAGKLHRDLKPSNVLITQDGRLVVLDFGLVSAAYARTQDGPLVAPPELGSARPALAASARESRRAHRALRKSPPVLIGTPGYMSPEQAAREPAQESSDWYAVGVMLFEVLTHRLPFDGDTRAVLRDKRVREAPSARELAPDVPVELDQLCRRLLARDPLQRAGAAEIRAWLGQRSATRSGMRRSLEVADSRFDAPQRRGSLHAAAGARPVAQRLIGRAHELQLMAAALDRSRHGGAEVWVAGAPGTGKSALLDAFAASVASETLVVRGRCHEEESIPLKVFDAIADGLRDALAGIAPAELPELAPRERAALVAAFPVLGEVPGLAPLPVGTRVRDAIEGVPDVDGLAETEPDTLSDRDFQFAEPGTHPTTQPELLDTADLQAAGTAATLASFPPRTAAGAASDLNQRYARACEALGMLLAGLAARRPLAILIDDLQWADRESAAQWQNVFRSGPSAAPLFIGTYRREEAASSGFVSAVSLKNAGRAAESLELAPLAAEAAAELARELLRAQDAPATPELCRKLASDTRGNPFLMTELVKQLKRPRRSSAFIRSSTGAIALTTAIRTRVDALPASARRLLAVLCVAHAPLALRAALTAAHLPIDEHAALTLVCSARLARSRGGRPIDTLEPYHERVREAVLQALSPDERRALEAEIARVG